jgi:alanyl-tRNA synthetase
VDKKGKTKQLYFDNPYQREFEAEVNRVVRRGGHYLVVLDQTCFYPESGGQPADKGSISDILVTDVYEDNHEIIHVLGEELTSKKIKGKIDWKTRFDHMQQHAGQHILSQCFHEYVRGETVSFHLGESISTVDIDIKKISEPDLIKVEHMANKIVFENREIKTYFLPEEKIPEVPLRKPPQKTGMIRIVEVAGFDHSACGGTHPRYTGEIGLIKIIGQERIRQNLRFTFVCGLRALWDYIKKDQVLTETAVRLSSHQEEVPAAVEKLFSELKAQKKKNRKITEKLNQWEAEQIVRKESGPVIKKIFKQKSKEQIRYLALHIIKNPGFMVVFGLIQEDRCHMVLARSEDIGFDMKTLIPVISSVMKVKGGGRPSLVELVGEEAGQLESALHKALESIPVK